MKRFILTLITVLAALLCAASLFAADAPKPVKELPAAVRLDELGQAKLQVLGLQGQIKELQSSKAQCEFALAQVNRDQQAKAQRVVEAAAPAAPGSDD